MNVVSQSYLLRERHAELQKQIDSEYQRPIPDDVHLHELKREKLRLKDQLSKVDS
ncbi:MAG: YdcH family protein [Rhodospirillales bacterium]|nr:YdcH family protein [Rhodospirillales bacterium]